jgi:hypothetical protein
MIVWKVMRREGDDLVSLSDPKLRFRGPRPGDVLLSAPHPGFWVSPIEKYCLTHYASGGAGEVLLKLSLHDQDIVKGSVWDKEPELSVSAARLMSVIPIPPSE